MNGADRSKRYPRIVEEASRIKFKAIMSQRERCTELWHAPQSSWGCQCGGVCIRSTDVRWRRFTTAATPRTQADTPEAFNPLEPRRANVWRRLQTWAWRNRVEAATSVYKSGPSKTRIKARNPKSAAATRIL